MERFISVTSRDLPGEDEKGLNNNNENMASTKCHDCVDAAPDVASAIIYTHVDQRSLTLEPSGDMEQYHYHAETSVPIARSVSDLDGKC